MRDLIPSLRLRQLGAAAFAGVALVLASLLTTPTASVAQVPLTKGGVPSRSAPPAPLARYVARDGLVAYVEFDGLDAHADAWTKTAAHDVLNATPTGAMLEDLATQLADKALVARPFGDMTGADLVAVVKHVAHAGFVFAANDPAGKSPGHSVVVLRDAAKTRELRSLFARLMKALSGPDAKMTIATKGTRKVAAIEAPKPSTGNWAWWAEKNQDLVIAWARLADADAIIATLDGKQPNAVDHPTRAALAKGGDGLHPVALAFVEPSSATGSVPKALKDNLQKLGLSGVQRIDYRWGFQDKALASVTRITAPSPRQGVLALFDQPALTAQTMPPMPAGLTEFSAWTVDPKALYEQLVAAASALDPEARKRFEAFEKAFKEKSRRDLRSDVLARFGSKMAFYLVPAAKPAATGKAGAAKVAAAVAGASSVGVQVPKFTVLVEVDDPTAVIKLLDELMIVANKEIRTAFAEYGKSDEAEKKDDESGESPKSSAAAKRDAPVFKMTPGSPKIYVLYLPSAMSSMTNLRLTVAVGKKYMAIASSSVEARNALALEGKPEGIWKPGPDQALVAERLSEGVNAVAVDDPAATMPEQLAALPTTIQTTSALLSAVNDPPAPVAANVGGRGRFGGRYPGAGLVGVPSPGSGSSGAEDPTNSSGADVVSGTEGGSGSQPPSTSAPQAKSATIQVDPAKVPKAAAIRKLLFPGLMTVSADSQQVRITTREAFPDVASAGVGLGALQLIQAVQQALAGRTPDANRSPFGGGYPGGYPGTGSGYPGGGGRSGSRVDD